MSEENLEQEQVDTPEVETEEVETEEVETPEVEEEAEEVEPDSDEEQVEGEEEAEAEAEDFVFDSKLKVMDTEVEVPDWIAKNVKSEDQAKFVKELFEKSHGLDAVKEKRDFFKEELSQTQTVVKDLNEQIRNQNDMFDFYDKLIQTKDLANFQKHSGISDDMILERAAEILRYQELTPMQKAEYDRSIESRQRLYDSEYQLQRLQQVKENEVVSQSMTQLENVLSQDTVSKVAQDFDSRLGANAFKNEVIQRAALYEKQTGKTLGIEEAVNYTLNFLGIPQGQSDTQKPQSVQTQASVKTSGSPQTTVVRREVKPTIPNLQGGNKNVAKPLVKSLDDLRALAQQQEY